MAMAMSLVPRALLFAACLFASFGLYAQFDAPFRYDGFSLEGPTTRTPVLLEVFTDPLCPDSRAAWPVIRQLTQVYSSDKLQVIVHPFPVPFHRNSFYGVWGLHIAAHFNRSLAIPFLESVFANQSSFSDISTFEEESQLTIKRFASLATEIGLDPYAFHEGYTIEFLRQAAVTSFKYACSRNIVGTPSHFVNGVIVSGSDEYTLSDWVDFLQPFFDSPTAPSHKHSFTM